MQISSTKTFWVIFFLVCLGILVFTLLRWKQVDFSSAIQVSNDSKLGNRNRPADFAGILSDFSAEPKLDIRSSNHNVSKGSDVSGTDQAKSTDLYFREKLLALLKPPIDEVDMEKSLSSLNMWASQNGLKPAEFLLSLQLETTILSELILEVYGRWGEYDAQAALSHAELHLSSFNDASRLTAVPLILLASCETSKDLSSCIGSLSHTAEIDRSLAYIADEKSAIEEQPDEAIAWAQLIQSESTRLDLIDDIAELWAELDPEAAILWALENNEIENVGMRSMVQISKNDPWAAQQILQSIPMDKAEVRHAMLNSLISAQVEQGNFDTVLAVLNSSATSESKIRYFEGFVEQWSLRDPSAAATSIMTLPQGKRRDVLLSKVAQYWGEQNPLAALEFISSIKDQATRKKVTSRTLISWSLRDIGSASQWLHNQPSSQQKDKTIARIVESLIGSQVPQESVLDLVETINDESLRKMMLEKADRAPIFQEET